MFNFLVERKIMKENVWQMLHLYARKFGKVNDHLLLQISKRSGILWKRTVHKELGTISWKRCQIFRIGKMSIYCCADQATIETIFRIINRDVVKSLMGVKMTCLLFHSRLLQKTVEWVYRLTGCCSTAEPNSSFPLVQSWSCRNEIFGGGRGDMYDFSYKTSPVFNLAIFGIKWTGSISWRMIAFDRVWFNVDLFGIVRSMSIQYVASWCFLRYAGI